MLLLFELFELKNFVFSANIDNFEYYNELVQHLFTIDETFVKIQGESLNEKNIIENELKVKNNDSKDEDLIVTNVKNKLNEYFDKIKGFTDKATKHKNDFIEKIKHVYENRFNAPSIDIEISTVYIDFINNNENVKKDENNLNINLLSSDEFNNDIIQQKIKDSVYYTDQIDKCNKNAQKYFDAYKTYKKQIMKIFVLEKHNIIEWCSGKQVHLNVLSVHLLNETMIFFDGIRLIITDFKKVIGEIKEEGKKLMTNFDDLLVAGLTVVEEKDIFDKFKSTFLTNCIEKDEVIVENAVKVVDGLINTLETEITKFTDSFDENIGKLANMSIKIENEFEQIDKLDKSEHDLSQIYEKEKDTMKFSDEGKTKLKDFIEKYSSDNKSYSVFLDEVKKQFDTFIEMCINKLEELKNTQKKIETKPESKTQEEIVNTDDTKNNETSTDKNVKISHEQLAENKGDSFKKIRKNLFIILGIVIPVILLSMVGFIAWKKYKKRKEQENRKRLIAIGESYKIPRVLNAKPIYK